MFLSAWGSTRFIIDFAQAVFVAQLRQVTLDGIVDTDTVSLVVPEEVATKLGLRRFSSRTVAHEVRPVAGPVTVRIGDRETGTDCVIGPPHKRQAEQLVARAAEDFDAFYEARRAAEGQSPPDGSVVVLTFDGKGVVLHREDLREATRKAAEQRRRSAPGSRDARLVAPVGRRVEVGEEEGLAGVRDGPGGNDPDVCLAGIGRLVVGVVRSGDGGNRVRPLRDAEGRRVGLPRIREIVPGRRRGGRRGGREDHAQLEAVRIRRRDESAQIEDAQCIRAVQRRVDQGSGSRPVCPSASARRDRR